MCCVEWNSYFFSEVQLLPGYATRPQLLFQIPHHRHHQLTLCTHFVGRERERERGKDWFVGCGHRTRKQSNGWRFLPAPQRAHGGGGGGGRGGGGGGSLQIGIQGREKLLYCPPVCVVKRMVIRYLYLQMQERERIRFSSLLDGKQKKNVPPPPTPTNDQFKHGFLKNMSPIAKVKGKRG